ncbi:TIGR01777 family protein [Conexibacter sp. W3-3-2]|uniref:TIGR01777 family protein n=1 Tax=Paraconexibacter algicola TaxID=2133960 RepID=A0A2T4UFU2_9ACTN|nr:MULTISPECIES: TIGR01777 family oxidoreductase [Solirubrobacterales]MTD42854.1 TIGR01777 family protein [Conexibacter sp. W3-3-2]PTL56656.1 TIGR01777 family protein [Paraconexibacter algicola]
MKVTVTGASGLIGTKLVAALKARGDDVLVLSRSPEKTSEKLGVPALAWDLLAGPPPAEAVDGRDAIVHLAGEPVAQRWNAQRKQAILESRETGTRNLVAGIAAATAKPSVLVSSSAVGYYGKHGDEKVPESSPAGDDFLADVCVRWEQEAEKASAAGVRVVLLRTGVVLDQAGGALKTMLPPFKAGVGGPVAGGKQYMPWIHVDDIVGLYLKALDDSAWSGAYNGSAPEPVTNKAFSKTLGKVLKRPAFSPVPAFALRILYGQMAEIVTEGQRAVPERPLAEGYSFRHTDLQAALADALGKG